MLMIVCHDGTPEDGVLRAAMLHKRWGWAPRSRRTGGGFKPPTAAAFKRGGGARAGKRQGETLSGEDQGDERE